MKYIDAEKLIAEIDRRRLSNRYIDTESYENELLEIINSLQQEQPEGGCSEKPNNLPSNMDEAAKEYMRNYIPFDQCDSRDIIRTFKSGAEWTAGQGVTKEAVIGMATEEISINVSQETLNELDLCPGDKVIVQIRKIL